MSLLLANRFLGLLATLFLTLFTSAYAQQPLVMAYGNNYRPLAWEEDGVMKGLQVDIIREAVEKRLGIAVSHRGFPWKRAQMLVELGVADGLLTVSTPERLHYATAAKEPLISVANTLYTYAGHQQLDALQAISTVSDLANYRLVDYIGGSWSKSQLQGANIVRVTEIDHALEFLSKKRADLFIQGAQITDYHIDKLGLKERVVKTGSVLNTQHFHLLIRNDSEFIHILPRVDAVINDMRRDGTLQAIYDKYQ